MAAFPGGTAAPGVPKGPPGVPKGKPGAPPRFLNKASGKMETAQAMKGYRAQAGAKAIGNVPHAPKAPAIQGSNGTGETGQRSWLDMNPSELHQYATKQVQQNTQTELAPYRQRAGEIYGTEQAVQGRYAGMGQATDQQLQGLQGQAAEGAKTFNNQVADTVLKANQSVDTTGQTAQAQNAGYLDPQLRAALAAQKGNVAETGLAQQGAAASQGQNEQNFMANLRAAATQRVAEGQKGITSTYGKQQAGVQGEQARLLGRQPGAISKLETELGQKAFTARATEAGLGLKQGDLRVKEAGVRGQERGRSITEGHYKETARQAQEKLGLERGKQGFDEWAKREDLNIKKLSATDKARYDASRIKIDQEKREGKEPNPAAGRKYLQTLNNALSTVRSELQRGEKKGFKGQQLYNIARKQLAEGKYTGKGGVEPGSPMGQNIVNAALNLAVYGRLSTADQAEAISLGLTPNLKPEWFRTK